MKVNIRVDLRRPLLKQPTNGQDHDFFPKISKKYNSKCMSMEKNPKMYIRRALIENSICF